MDPQYVSSLLSLLGQLPGMMGQNSGYMQPINIGTPFQPDPTGAVGSANQIFANSQLPNSNQSYTGLGALPGSGGPYGNLMNQYTAMLNGMQGPTPSPGVDPTNIAMQYPSPASGGGPTFNINATGGSSNADAIALAMGGGAPGSTGTGTGTGQNPTLTTPPNPYMPPASNTSGGATTGGGTGLTPYMPSLGSPYGSNPYSPYGGGGSSPYTPYSPYGGGGGGILPSSPIGGYNPYPGYGGSPGPSGGTLPQMPYADPTGGGSTLTGDFGTGGTTDPYYQINPAGTGYTVPPGGGSPSYNPALGGYQAMPQTPVPGVPGSYQNMTPLANPGYAPLGGNSPYSQYMSPPMQSPYGSQQSLSSYLPQMAPPSGLSPMSANMQTDQSGYDPMAMFGGTSAQQPINPAWLANLNPAQHPVYDPNPPGNGGFGTALGPQWNGAYNGQLPSANGMQGASQIQGPSGFGGQSFPTNSPNNTSGLYPTMGSNTANNGFNYYSGAYNDGSSPNGYQGGNYQPPSGPTAGFVPFGGAVGLPSMGGGQAGQYGPVSQGNYMSPTGQPNSLGGRQPAQQPQGQHFYGMTDQGYAPPSNWPPAYQPPQQPPQPQQGPWGTSQGYGMQGGGQMQGNQQQSGGQQQAPHGGAQPVQPRTPQRVPSQTMQAPAQRTPDQSMQAPPAQPAQQGQESQPTPQPPTDQGTAPPAQPPAPQQGNQQGGRQRQQDQGWGQQQGRNRFMSPPMQHGPQQGGFGGGYRPQGNFGGGFSGGFGGQQGGQQGFQTPQMGRMGARGGGWGQWQGQQGGQGLSGFMPQPKFRQAGRFGGGFGGGFGQQGGFSQQSRQMQ